MNRETKQGKSKLGVVYLVGAGPGDPGLITVKGLQYLESADVVVYDRLVDARLLNRVKPDVELIDVGKTPGDGRRTQAEANALLVHHAKEGKHVVRLKGGDPFVFGRGGEEADELSKAGIPFEVVPGVTSAVAAPAYAGIPLTHRDFASSVTFVTGSESPDKPDSAVAWGKLAQAGGTLVVLMGWQNLSSITSTLLQGGRDAETPTALVEWGTEPVQRTVVGTLSDIAEKGQRAGLSPPVIVVIGGVVGLRSRLRWFDNRPLFSKRVLVTRPSRQTHDLSELLSREGALPIEVPTIEVREPADSLGLDAAVAELSTYDWVVFASANGVEAVFEQLGRQGRDARAFGGAKVAAIGTATAASLKARGIVAEYVPEEFVSEAVVEGLKQRGIQESKVLVPRPDIGRETLVDGLEGLGASVNDVTAYRTVLPEESRTHLHEVLSQGLDAVTFTSSSTVINFVKLLDGQLDSLSETKIACIGPITAATTEELGLPVHVVAEEYTAAGLVEAIRAYFSEETPHDG